MNITLQQVGDPDRLVLVVTFHQASERTAFAYPVVTDFEFTSTLGGLCPWQTSVMSHEPFDTLILNPWDEISFTFRLDRIEAGFSCGRWQVPGRPDRVRFHYRVPDKHPLREHHGAHMQPDSRLYCSRIHLAETYSNELLIAQSF